MVKFILPNEKCFPSAGSALVRTWAGSIAVRLSAVRLESRQIFAEGLLCWGELRETKLLAPFSIQLKQQMAS
jgi:hypothetical protein